jgi:sugar phosphate isomerase/epimerase
MKLSIASYSFHGLFYKGAIDLFGYLESVKFRYQLSTADIWNNMLISMEHDYLQKVKRALDERELSLVNICVDGAHIWEDDASVREEHYRKALESLAAAELFSAETVRIDAGGRGEDFTEEEFDLIVKRYKEYAQRAYDNGYKVGPENHWGAEVKPENMKKLCEAVDHPGFGVLLHFKNSEDRLFAPWAMHTHISWETVTSNLEESLKTLADTGYKGSWSVEHHSGEREYDETAIQLAMIRNTLKRLGVE